VENGAQNIRKKLTVTVPKDFLKNNIVDMGGKLVKIDDCNSYSYSYVIPPD